jgi:NitT/TauT family transport system permease protein
MRLHRLIIPALLLLLWALLVIARVFPAVLIPSPLAVAQVLWTPAALRQVSGDLLTTVLRLAAGFVAAGVLGIAVGVAMGRSRGTFDLFDFLVSFCGSIPIPALFPLFLVLLGIGEASKFATIVWATSLVVLVSTIYGVQSCSPTRQRFARTLGASELQIIWTIVLPEALPSILAGLRTGIAVSLLAALVSEMFLGTTSGLGHRILESALVYDTPLLYFTIAVVGLLGYGLNQAFTLVERRLLHWNQPL